MANVYRIFVEKKKGNDIEAMQILTDLRQNVGITALTGLRLINRYDVQGVSEAEFRRAVHGVFAEDKSGQYGRRSNLRPRRAGVCHGVPARPIRPAGRQRRPVHSAAHRRRMSPKVASAKVTPLPATLRTRSLIRLNPT